LNDNDIKGAKWILLNINSAEGDYECSMDELETINTILRARTGEHSDVIMGMGYDESLGDKLGITLIATGFEHKDPFKKEAVKEVEAPLEEKIMMTLQSEQLEQTPAIEPTDINAPNDLIAPELTEAAAVLDTVEITVDEIEIPMDELAPTMQEFVMPEMSNVYVSAPDYDEEEEVIPAFEAIESSFEEEVISQEIVLEDFNASFEEEEVSEVFELNMEEEEAPSFTTEFVLNKPVNIYAESELEATPEPSIPTNNEVIANTVVFESIEPIATEIAAEAENVETSFRNVEMDTEEAPTMQLVMREESVGTQQNRPQHSNFDISLDNSEEQRRKVAERIQKLRNLSFNINNGSDPGVEFDAVPAYVRRNLDLFGNTMASVENYYSKYTVEQDEHNQTQISTINSFLDGKKPD
jgi:cell division protein FtsZ